MEIEGFEDLPKLFISPIEKLMDEFKGSVKEFRGLFKVPRENIFGIAKHTASTNLSYFKRLLRKYSGGMQFVWSRIHKR